MNKLVILSVLASIGFSFGFQRPHQRGAVGFGVKVPSKLFAVQDRGDFPPEESEEYTGSVDWDAEWKKVVAGDGKATGSERPGKEFYKSEAEIAAIKAANKASQTANEIGSNVSNSMPSMGSLSGDWKFWIAILAVVSIGLSVLSAPSNIPTNIPQGGSDGSFYI